MKGITMAKKSRGQKRQAKIKKRQQRRSRASSPPSMPPPFLGGMPFGGEPEAPKGFRPVSTTQAMMEYAAPIMAYVEDGTVADPNDALQVGLLLWNYTLPEVPVAMRQSRRAIVAQIETTLHMDREAAEAFCDEMIERKAYLFPDEMQPDGVPMTMFMRKEVEYLITPFAESQLNLSDEIVPPTNDDDTFVKALEELDARIDFGEEYGDWESDFFEMKDLCCERYDHWLQAKGVPETFRDQFSACIEPYLNFIYRYDAGDLLHVMPDTMEEFFMDWLMRKVMVQPPEYTLWPPALRLFYRFLSEKGYLDHNLEPILQGLYAIEPQFIALVKQRS
jgi:hypothetical protein